MIIIYFQAPSAGNHRYGRAVPPQASATTDSRLDAHDLDNQKAVVSQGDSHAKGCSNKLAKREALHVNNVHPQHIVFVYNTMIDQS